MGIGVKLNSGKHTTVDEEDYEDIIKHKWYFDASHGYVRNGKLGYLHRYIMRAEPGTYIDHRDGNPLNNQRHNLRVCSNAENIRNSKRRSTNTSGHTGVWYRKERNLWVAEIKYNYRKIYIGGFKKKEEAIAARRAKAAELFGDFNRIESE